MSPKAQLYKKFTKRTILSLSSSLFDPLSFVAPCIIKAKIIKQKLWILKVGWDESIPHELHTAWENLVLDINLLTSFLVEFESVQLYGLCDASIRAYDCYFYIWSKTSSGNVTIRFFAAKSSVAPTKGKPLPKLELCGALLLAKVYSKIKNLFEIPNLQVILWTDSEIVLHWLRQHSSTLSVFVGTRILLPPMLSLSP